MNSLLLCASLALSVVVSQAATPCTATGRSCIAGRADCINQKCVCKPAYPNGNGAFACYKDSVVSAMIFNDPVLSNFNGESLEFPFPCRFLSTHFINDLRVNNQKIGTCEFQIYSFNAKKKGKFFLHGFDVAARIKYDNGETVKMSSRHFGVAKWGTYHFKNRGFYGQYYQNGPWRNDKVDYQDDVNGVYIKGKRDAYDNNQLIYLAEQCGLEITFVPYDLKERRSQPSVPGIAIMVDTNYNTRWLSNDEVVNLAPHLTFADKKINGLTIDQSMFVRAFKTPFVQNQPMKDKGKCEATKKAFHKCTRPEVRKAMQNCYWILNQPKFIHCFDKSRSARNILRLFSSCIKVWCGTGSCEKVKNMIVTATCDLVEGVPEVGIFLNNTCSLDTQS